MPPKKIIPRKPRQATMPTIATWTEVGVGEGDTAFNRRIMVPSVDQYPFYLTGGVHFYVDGVFVNSDDTGQLDNSEFQMMPPPTLVGGEVLLATWTDIHGVSRSSTYTVPVPPAIDAKASGDIKIVGSADAAALVPPSGWPDATNTGPSGTLTTFNGTYTVSTNGAVVENLHINGKLVLNASNVTVRNCRIVNTTNKYCIEMTPGSSGHLIEDCEVNGNNWATHGIVFAGYTIRRCNIWNVGDGLRIGTNTTVEDCWIHDLSHNLLIEPSPHYDCIQSLGGYNQIIRRNNLEAKFRSQTSAIIWSSFGVNLGAGNIIENNRLSGGNYTLIIGPNNSPDTYSYTASPYQITHPQIVRNNVFVRYSSTYGPLSYDTYTDDSGVLRRFPPMPSATWRPATNHERFAPNGASYFPGWQAFSGNVFDTGGSVYPGMGYDMPPT